MKTENHKESYGSVEALPDASVKTKYQKFTPPAIAAEMLDLAGYDAADHILGKKVLENSFGNGNILCAIVEEYIKCGLERGLTGAAISHGLASDICGIELDAVLVSEASARLTELTERYSIPEVHWNLRCADALTWKYDTFFDYIIGNPPYITYNEIDKEERDRLRKDFSSCSEGKFDYCYAFIESALNLLSPSGKLVQLIPGSIYKNAYAEKLREKLKDHISQIIIFPSQELFKDVPNSTSIFLYDNRCTSKELRYINRTTGEQVLLERDSLDGKWIFSSQKEDSGDTRFGDIFRVSSAVATLKNDAFLLSDEQIQSVEPEVVRPAVSPKLQRSGKSKHIIFPYSYSEDGALQRFDAQKFQGQYPRAAAHLKARKDDLKRRATDPSAKWFEYGRSQALLHLNQPKLILSTVVTDKVEVYRADKSSIPFAGIYIVPLNEQADLDRAYTILKSREFLDYACQVGVPLKGGAVRISCKDISDYRFLWGKS